MRTEKYKKIDALEDFLIELNQNFAIIEKQKIEGFHQPQRPLVFVIGSPRSGTTLMMQYLAKSGVFGYPSNFISRFYESPYWAIQIQKLILDPKYNYNNELIDIIPDIDFSSYLGKTKGFLAPNEFWYFWRRFFKFDENSNALSPEQLLKTESSLFLKELAAMEDAFQKPLAFKGMILNWNIEHLMDILNRKVVFIYTKRKAAYNIQSLLKARINFRGDEKSWYSFKPPEYNELVKLDPVKQVAGQIHYTNMAIERQLERISEKNKVIVNYEEFCESNNGLTEELNHCFKLLGHEINLNPVDYQFKSSNKITVDDSKWHEIEKAVLYFK